MTVLGKILVFINLVFSLLVGGLVVMVYMARTNYAHKLETSEKYRKVVEASAQTAKDKAKAEMDELNARVQAMATSLQKAQQDLQSQIARNADLETKLVEEQKKGNTSAALVKSSQVEVIRRQTDVQEMRATLQNEMKKNETLVIDNNKLREQATQASLLSRTLQDRLKRVENMLQEKTRELVRFKANIGTDTPEVAKNGKNPPAETVEGIVESFDPESRLAKISIGSDSGLQSGHTMELFRLSNIPSQSKYLGTLKIIEVRPKAAVALPLTPLSGNPKKGDRVASRIFGS